MVALMSQSRYDEKREFGTTPEPRAEHGSEDVDPLTAPVGSRFVIQQHHATAFHHDVRLEMIDDGTPVLVSWAVPKRLPRRRGGRALAIRTEDHPMGYGSFSGTIPDGEYGAGEVRIFDEGEYEMVARTDDRLTVRLEGRRLAGIWHLVHTGPESGRDQWLAIMSEDRRRQGDDPPRAAPMLATPTAEAFDDPAWQFEPKWDGIRAIAVCGEDTRLVSRNRRTITVAYPELQRIHEQVVAFDAMLDGEIVAVDEAAPSFQRLQQRMHLRDSGRIEQAAKRIPVTFIAFDLLYLDGTDLTNAPLERRRLSLEEAIVPSERVQLSPITRGDGIALFQAAAEQGLEGIVAKRLASRYRPGARSRDWLKVKITFHADVVIVGWTEGEGHRAGRLGSLMMAVYEGDELRYVGNVGSGFDDGMLVDALLRLNDLEETAPPFPPEVLRSRPGLDRGHWVAPSLVARVEHRQLTAAGRLRAPVFQGFREDKSPEECTLAGLLAEAAP
jgi:bifunctional non-homologous end joining protein LigD